MVTHTGNGVSSIPHFHHAIINLMIKKKIESRYYTKGQKCISGYINDSYIIMVIMVIKEFMMAMTTMYIMQIVTDNDIATEDDRGKCQNADAAAADDDNLI